MRCEKSTHEHPNSPTWKSPQPGPEFAPTIGKKFLEYDKIYKIQCP